MYIAKYIISIFLEVHGSKLISMAEAQLTELEVFISHYASLCNTLVVDIHNLLLYFLRDHIIDFIVLHEINSFKTNHKKVERVLSYISDPLKAGNSTNFYKMLTIMEECGIQSTKNLAVKLKSELTSSSVKRKPGGWVYFCCKLAFMCEIILL